MTAPPVVEGTPTSLRSVVARRSPGIAAALDEGQAWARAQAWAAHAVPGATVGAVRVGWALYHLDGDCTLRYLVRLAPSGREQILLVTVPRSSSEIVVRPFPDDPGLPTLRRALDPLLMREVLGRVVPGTGGERGVARCRVDVVRYPRQGRCVVRYRLSPGAGGAGELRHPEVFGKVYGDHGAATAAAALRLLRDGVRRLPEDLRIDVPRALAVVPPLRLGLAEAVPGRALLPDLVKAVCAPGAAPGGPDRDALREGLRRAAGLAAAVHLCSPPGHGLPVRDLAGEQAATERDLALLEEIWPEAAGLLRRSLARALEAAADHGGGMAAPWPDRPVLAHGDLTPGQVLTDASGRNALVDVDTLCIAEPALDLGRFLAYLHVTAARRSPAALPALGVLSESFLDDYLDAFLQCGAVAAAPEARRMLRSRTAAYRALALARIGVSACRQLKDHRLGAVVDALDASDEWTRSGAG